VDQDVGRIGHRLILERQRLRAPMAITSAEEEMAAATASDYQETLIAWLGLDGVETEL